MMITEHYRHETGLIHTKRGKVWFKKTLGGNKLPVVTLHGGPGFPHDYLENLEELSKDRTVVFYDQLGCGRSDRPTDESLWKVETFVEGLEELRNALGFNQIHLLGSSWGTMLAVDYTLKFPERVKSLVLSSPCLSAHYWSEDAKILCAEMGEEWNRKRLAQEEAGTTSSPEFQALVKEFNLKYVYRVVPPSPVIARALSCAGYPTYKIMWGPAEFRLTGNLKNYDRVGDLPRITHPTLFTCGRFDEARPETAQLYASKMKSARVKVFEKSAHLAHLEEPVAYISEVSRFLASVD
jgi:proline iminopeptidase